MKEQVIDGIDGLQDHFTKHVIVVCGDRSLDGLNHFICFLKIVLKDFMINYIMKCFSSNHEELLLFHFLIWGRERCSLMREHDI